MGPGRGIALVGYRGTGKSTVGRIVADRLGRPFADADKEVEAAEGRPIREIFADGGEPAFREAEARALADLFDRMPGGVVATGGGAVLREENRRALRAFGRVVWLAARPETLQARIAASARGLADRPALTSLGTLDEVAAVLAAREPLYREVADVVVDTEGRTPREVAEAILRAVRPHAEGRP